MEHSQVNAPLWTEVCAFTKELIDQWNSRPFAKFQSKLFEC